MAFSPDGRRIFSSSDDGTVKVWDVDTGHETLTLKRFIHGLALSPDGKCIVVAGRFAGPLEVLDASGRRQLP